MSAPFYTAWVRLDLCHQYGGQKSHTASDALTHTLCGRFPRYALGDFTAKRHDDPPTCKKCRDLDRRFGGDA